MTTTNMSISYITYIPTEILAMILGHISVLDLKAISLTCRICRTISAPLLFRRVKVYFSKIGMRDLESIARSSLATQVQNIHYEASELIDPCAYHLSWSILLSTLTKFSDW